MNNAFKDRIGVTSEEAVANALNLGSDVSVRNIGLLVERERGVENLAQLVTDPKTDTLIFGGDNPSMYSSYTVSMLFNNTGGYSVNLYQARLIGTGTLAAQGVVKNQGLNNQSFTNSTDQVPTSTQKKIQRVSARNVHVGDVFTLVINATTFTATAASTDPSALYAQFISQIAANSTINLIVTTSIANGSDTIPDLILTGITNNVNYTVTTSTSNASVAVDIFRVIAGNQNRPDKGTWGNSLRVKVYPIGAIGGTSAGYFMQVFYKGTQVEKYTSNGNDWQSLLDQVNQQSSYVLIEAIDLTQALTLAVSDVTLSGGVYVAPADADFEPTYDDVTGEPLGMALFEGVDVQIVACPERFDATYHSLCDAWAEEQDKFYIFCPPYLATEATVEALFNLLANPAQSYSAGYLPWCEIRDTTDSTKTLMVPSLGYVLGAGYIRACALQNGYAWIPPAGINTNAKGILSFTHDKLTEVTMSRYVTQWRMNVIKFVRNTGFIIYSSRTYSTNILFESIHVRLETTWILATLRERNQNFIQRLYTPTLKKDLTTDNQLFFKDLYEKGGIEKTISFDQAVIIDVQQDLNDRKAVEEDIAWIPPECVEHIHMKMSRNDGIIVTNALSS